MSQDRIAIIYDRASSQGQKDNFARGDAARLYRLAEQRGLRWELRQEIKSGEEIANRPVMRGILDEIADAQVAALIVQDFTRLSRAKMASTGASSGSSVAITAVSSSRRKRSTTSARTPTTTWPTCSSSSASGRSGRASGQ